MLSPEDQQRLSTTFNNAPLSSHGSRWDSLYRDNYTPWDRAGPSLALADILLERTDLNPPAVESPGSSSGGAEGRRRTALVPGCGRGHDVLLLAAFGYDVWGLDTSDAAVDAARENEKATAARGEVLYQTPDGVSPGSVTWCAGDFFAEDWAVGKGTDGSGKFDLVFDYTFLCALPLSARPQWASRMTSLVSHKGRLICLEFPSDKPLSAGGPAWGVTPEVYEALLSAPGETVEYGKSGEVVSVPSPKPRDHALHRLSIIKPKRTHKAGTSAEGKVNDFISVWSH